MSAKSSASSSYEKHLIEFLRNRRGTFRGGRDNLVGFLASKLGITVRGTTQEQVVRALLDSMQSKGILVVETSSVIPHHIVALHLAPQFKRRHTRRKPKQN